MSSLSEGIPLQGSNFVFINLLHCGIDRWEGTVNIEGGENAHTPGPASEPHWHWQASIQVPPCSLSVSVPSRWIQSGKCATVTYLPAPSQRPGPRIRLVLPVTVASSTVTQFLYAKFWRTPNIIILGMGGKSPSVPGTGRAAKCVFIAPRGVRPSLLCLWSRLL